MPVQSTLRFRLLTGFLLAVSALPFPLLGADSAAGVGNFHQVADRLYRGAQPTADGFHSLAGLGIHTVVDLREAGQRSAWEKKLVESAGMRYVNIPLNGFTAPPPDKVRQILALFEDPNSGAVFIHCHRGADRTGTLVACYRITHDKWANRKALQEAKGMGMHWFEFSMKNYVLGYQPSVPATVVAVN